MVNLICVITFHFIFSSCKDELSDDVIPIRQYVSLSGSEATFGISTDHGLKLAVEEVNEQSGVLGKQISLISADNRGQTNKTITVVEKLISRNKVIFVIGEIASSRIIAGAQICQKFRH